MMGNTYRTHKWDWDNEQYIPFVDSKDGCSRNIKVCEHCKTKMITIMPPVGYPAHEFHLTNGTVLKQEKRPPCLPNEKVKAA